MRAAYLVVATLVEGQLVEVEGDTFHHWVNVLRIKTREEILVLNGRGLRAQARVSEIKKRSLVLEVMVVRQSQRSTNPDVLILTPKRDALESMLKAAVEWGCPKIWLMRGEYSQEKLLETRRIEALLQSALEQSNNPWLPDVLALSGWDQLVLDSYEHIFVLDVARQTHVTQVRNSGQKVLLVVGPEAGFSESERLRLLQWKKIEIISLPTPILRAPTAMVGGLGWWSGRT